MFDAIKLHLTHLSEELNDDISFEYRASCSSPCDQYPLMKEQFRIASSSYGIIYKCSMQQILKVTKQDFFKLQEQ